MDYFIDDVFRVMGSRKKGDIIRSFKDYRIRYLFLWRRINENNNKRNLIKKMCLNALRNRYHIEIPYSAVIKAGFYMEHAYNITISSKALIGKNVTVLKGVTVGKTLKGAPVIGDNVYLGINSVVVGNIRIGNNVMICANSFVNFDVPDNSIVIGNPGVIHNSPDCTRGYIQNPV